MGELLCIRKREMQLMCCREMVESGAELVRPGSTGADLVRSIKPTYAKNLNCEELLKGTIQLIMV